MNISIIKSDFPIVYPNNVFGTITIVKMVYNPKYWLLFLFFIFGKSSHAYSHCRTDMYVTTDEG